MDFSGIEKLSFVDWDKKIVCTLFTRGCNFRCPFCHNGFLVVNPDEDSTIPFEEIINYLSKRKNMLDGVVISGGEPTLMPDIVDKIKKIKELGYKIKLDTNGSNPKILKYLVNNSLVDYVAMDIKNSKIKYAETVGISNVNFKNIEESITFLMSGNIPFEFRTTLVKEFHDEQSIKELGELINGAPVLFLQHFKNVDGCISHDLHEISFEEATTFAKILKPYVKQVVLRGYSK
jgi:pyruvate formate lyase activating enzyme